MKRQQSQQQSQHRKKEGGARVRGKRRWTAAAIISLLGLGSTGMGRAIALCPSQLPAHIDAIAQQPAFARARWGIRVEPLTAPGAAPTTAQPLYDQAGHQHFVPASNVKLLTTAAALSLLGQGFRVHTSVYLEPPQPSGSVEAAGAAPTIESPSLGSPNLVSPTASLRLVGQGDPSITTATLQQLAQQVRNRGITHIPQLTLDDHYFRGDPVNPTWEWSDVQAGYGASANALILNGNEIVVDLLPQAVGQSLRVEWQTPAEASAWQVLNRSTTVAPSAPVGVSVGRDPSRPILQVNGQLRTNSNRDRTVLSVPNPTEHFGHQFRQALVAAGVRVDHVRVLPAQSSRSSTVPPSIIQAAIASVSSPPLLDWLRWANRDSNNVASESLLRQLGAIRAAPRTTNASPASPHPLSTTLTDSIAQLRSVLDRLGVSPELYTIADGSGLSRHNAASPLAFVQLLQRMAHHPLGSLYQESLAIAGRTGTLRSRLRNTPGEGRVYAKSGGLTGVASLSGYAYPPNYPPLVFSIILNHSSQFGRVNRQAIDDMVLGLMTLESCSPP